MTSPAAPLAGVRILDMTRLLPGNFATVLLADMGAEVIKVETAEGDGTRYVAPHLPSGESGGFVQLNYGKDSVVIDLKTPEGRQRLAGLVASADALVDSFRPGVLDRLGFGRGRLEQLCPELVHVTINAYGSGGPLEKVPGHDLNAQGYAGILAPAGDPSVPATQTADLAAGLHAALAVTAGLRVDGFFFAEVAMSDAAMTMAQLSLGHGLATGQDPLHPDNLTGRWACYDLYECADGKWLTVGGLEPKFFARMLELMDMSDWAPRQYELSAQGQLRTELAKRFRGRSQADWLELLAHEDTCVGPVLGLAEALQHVNAVQRRIWRIVPTGEGERTVFAAAPWLPTHARRPAAPPLGGTHPEQPASKT